MTQQAPHAMEPDSPAPPTSPRGAALHILAAILLYSALTFVFTYPQGLTWDTHIFGGGGDGPMFVWNLWWGAHAVFEEGTNPFFSELLYHPEGAPLVFNTHALMPSLLSYPFQKLFGLVGAFNIVIGLTFVLSGLGAYLLAYDVTQDRRVALVAGAMFAFAHTRVSAVMFLNLIQTQWLVLFLWAAWRAWTRDASGWAVVAGVLASCLLYSSYNLMVLAALWGALALFYTLWRKRGLGLPVAPTLRCAGVMVGVIVLLGLPLWIAVAMEVSSNGYYVTNLESETRNTSIPLARFLVRNPLASAEGPIRQASYLGYSVMLPALVGLIWGRRNPDVVFWSLSAGGFLLLSLGPELNLDGFLGLGHLGWTIPLPFRFTGGIPLVEDVRVAHRYGFLGCIALMVVAAYGLKAAVEALDARGLSKVALGATAVAIAVVVLDFAQLPFPKRYQLPQPPAAAMEAIAQDPRGSAVFEYPKPTGNGYTGFSYFRTVHGQPGYMSGHMARTPPVLRKAANDSQMFRSFKRVWNGKPLKPRAAKQMRREVRDAQVGWIMIAWADRGILKGENEPSQATLEALDAMVHDTFEVEEVVYDAGPDAIARWEATARETDAIYRVYKINP